MTELLNKRNDEISARKSVKTPYYGKLVIRTLAEEFAMEIRCKGNE